MMNGRGYSVLIQLALSVIILVAVTGAGISGGQGGAGGLGGGGIGMRGGESIEIHRLSPSLLESDQRLYDFAVPSAPLIDLLDKPTPKVPFEYYPGQRLRKSLPLVQNPPIPQSPPKLEDPRTRAQQVVTDRDNPAYTGKGKELAGRNGSPWAPANPGIPWTDNGNAQHFVDRFPSVPQAIAAVIRVTDSAHPAELLGTAVLIAQDAVVSAGHVVQAVIHRNWYTSPGAVKTLEDGIYLIFDLDITKFPTGFKAGYDWSQDPNTVHVPIGSWAVTHSDADVGAIRIAAQPNRPAVKLDPKDHLLKDMELALLGVPGLPNDGEAGNLIDWKRNYEISGLPGSTSLEPDNAPVVIRIGTGKFLGQVGMDKPWMFRYNIDTLGGNSGSGIFEANNGGLVGINYAGEEAYANEEGLRYNKGVIGTVVAETIAQLPSSSN